MNLFLTGAAKAGTTSLYYYLEQHPDIVTPRVKEPHYFSHIHPDERIVFARGGGRGDKSTIWVYDKQQYLQLFRGRNSRNSQHQVYIDAAVTNLYSETAASEIKKFDPQARIIIMLRNPADRAWSHYNHLVRDGRETEPFGKGLELEKERIKKRWEFSWHYKQMGLYDEQVERYITLFPKNQVMIILFEDFIRNPTAVLREVCRFSGLSGFDFSEEPLHNISGKSRSPGLAYLADQIAGYKKTIHRIIPPSVTHKAIQMFRKINVKEHHEKMEEETRRFLGEYFYKSIQRTEQLIRRDLSHWT